MIQSLFLLNDCNDGSERFQPGVDWRGRQRLCVSCLCAFLCVCVLTDARMGKGKAVSKGEEHDGHSDGTIKWICCWICGIE